VLNVGGNSFRINPARTVNLLKDLIKIPSVNPAIEGQGEGAIGSYIADTFRRTRQFHVYEQRVAKNRFNVVAVLNGRGVGRSLMLNGHMDTVGTSDMTVDPFRAFVKQGRMHGRGACDMKGPISAMMSAMIAIAKSNQKPAGDIMFAGVVDEEFQSIGTTNLIKRYRTDAAIVGEPTGMDIAIAHKGYAWLEIETIGKRAHGSVPEQGIDAIENMAKLITDLDSLRRRLRLKRHARLGTPKIHTSTISGGSDWSSVPAKCVLRIERRLLPGEHPRDAVKELREIVARCAKSNEKMRATVRLINHRDSMEVDAKTAHVQVLRSTVRSLGGSGRIVGVPYTTDASILLRQAQIPSCIFGPGDVKLAHNPDEYINIKDVMTAANVYAHTALQYCAGN
jgi:acetylornithine deacetylase/succinyl-diaminopimelate desuccinylase family protein